MQERRKSSGPLDGIEQLDDDLESSLGEITNVGSPTPMLPMVYLSTETKGKKFSKEMILHIKHSVLFACAAECFTTCCVPHWAHTSTGINLSATILNIIGPFLEGIAFTLQNSTAQEDWKRACRYFRSVFLGVFTSYCFMVDHAGDLAGRNGFLAPLYILSTMCYASVAFMLGQQLLKWSIENRRFPRHLPPVIHLWNFLLLFSGIIVLIALVGPKGFVRDPKDAHFLGTILVNEALELIVGMIMSCGGIFLSMYIGYGKYEGTVDWGAWRCNTSSVIFLVLAYALSYFLPNAVQNVIVAKFVSSFCGSLSCFSTAISTTMILAQTNQKQLALISFGVTATTALIFIPYLSK
ncbi:hypothetical protein THRCLA_05569 [Thraustotheca clavata]|uniref:Transmembrane protein n=1 Tax=Thraustotheca clavata TaxID=74557 RepID=A0A1V9ZVI1_9STRA|nr:hypothetical protein THRCLA_05569 [Thraustotheca clavata]